jgi:uncharacterized protein YyaL (SSP411 family)
VALASSLDADSVANGEHHEGATYLWTPGELENLLGSDDGAAVARTMNVAEQGTVSELGSPLHPARALSPEEAAQWAAVRPRLLAARAARPQPARDDKVVAGWNGLAISGLVAAWQRLGEDAWLDAAVEAGRLLRDLHLVDAPTGSERPRLHRVSRDGVVGAPAGVLEDLGCVAAAWVDLAAATGDATWLDHARVLLEDALERFRADDGGFHDTAADAEALVARPRDPSDNASPSGASALVHALLGFGALTGEQPWSEAAEEAIATVSALLTGAPRFAGWWLAAAEAMRSGPAEVAVVGRPGPERDALARAAYHLPGALVVVASPGESGIPLLEGRGEVEGRPAAYVCRRHVCAAPVTDPAAVSLP